MAAAWLAMQLFRNIYAAENLDAARAALNAFYKHCKDRAVPELDTLARTVRSWEQEILAYHTTGQSNGPTEAVNLLIEKVRRVGHGFRNFDLCRKQHKSNYVAGRVMSRGRIRRLVPRRCS
jgi:transposase